MKDNKNPVWYIVIALTIWCVWNSVSSNNFVSKLADIHTQQQIVTREVSHLMDRLQALESIEPEVIVKEVVKEVVKEIEVPVEVEEVIDDIIKEGE